MNSFDAKNVDPNGKFGAAPAGKRGSPAAPRKVTVANVGSKPPVVPPKPQGEVAGTPAQPGAKPAVTKS